MRSSSPHTKWNNEQKVLILNTFRFLKATEIYLFDILNWKNYIHTNEREILRVWCWKAYGRYGYILDKMIFVDIL